MQRPRGLMNREGSFRQSDIILPGMGRCSRDEVIVAKMSSWIGSRCGEIDQRFDDFVGDRCIRGPAPRGGHSLRGRPAGE